MPKGLLGRYVRRTGDMVREPSAPAGVEVIPLGQLDYFKGKGFMEVPAEAVSGLDKRLMQELHGLDDSTLAEVARNVFADDIRRTGMDMTEGAPRPELLSRIWKNLTFVAPAQGL